MPAVAKAKAKRNPNAGSQVVEGKFKTWLAMPGQGSWCFLTVKDSAEIFATRARVPVRGTINGFEFVSSLLPDGKGNHALMVNKHMQQGGGFKPGESVRLTLAVDTAPRVVELPALVRKALGAEKEAKAFFDNLAPSHKKRYVEWVMEAKQPETRARRVTKMMTMLAAGEKMD
jgi:hypothetical protein